METSIVNALKSGVVMYVTFSDRRLYWDDISGNWVVQDSRRCKFQSTRSGGSATISPALKAKRQQELAYLINRCIFWGYAVSMGILFIYFLFRGN